ncbi:helix-turn-helix domain-containing protein [Streptomyces sp. NPDC003635]
MGALTLLAELPEGAVRADPDVAAIGRMHPGDLRTLDLYRAAGSPRRAAELLHPHHSSVARGIEQLGRSLGLDLTEPTGLTRARIALTAWRLLAE